jgi:hypothetical protein
MDHNLPQDLLDLKARFDAWRRIRKSPRAKTPDDLLQAALAMRDRYPARVVCDACRISSNTFTKAAASTASPKKRKSTASFFKLPPISETSSQPCQTNHDCRIQFERPDGSRLTLTLPVSDSLTINRLVADFLRGSDR